MFGNSDFLEEYISSNNLFCETTSSTICKKPSSSSLVFSEIEQDERKIFTQNYEMENNFVPLQGWLNPSNPKSPQICEEDKQMAPCCLSSNSDPLSGPVSDNAQLSESANSENASDKPGKGELSEDSLRSSLEDLSGTSDKPSGEELQNKFSNRIRFSKTHDRDMFKRLRELCEERSIIITDFWKSKSIKDDSLWEILQILCKEICWDPEKADKLVTRIRKIGKNSKHFTIREVKHLRKLINSQRKETGRVDLSEISYYFPGKSMETLKGKYNEKYTKRSPNQLL